MLRVNYVSMLNSSKKHIVLTVAYRLRFYTHSEVLISFWWLHPFTSIFVGCRSFQLNQFINLSQKSNISIIPLTKRIFQVIIVVEDSPCRREECCQTGRGRRRLKHAALCSTWVSCFQWIWAEENQEQRCGRQTVQRAMIYNVTGRWSVCCETE